MRFYFAFIALTMLFSVSANGQFLMKGKVLDADTFQPLEFATVFITNTTFGDISNSEGFFEIEIPSGDYELVISYMGYQVFKFPFSTNALKDSYEFRILQETIDLEELKVEEKRDKEWYRNLKLFEELFLGQSVNGQKTKILNPEVLALDRESSANKLIVRSRDMLEIHNPNLGYQIKYVLEYFVHDFETEVTRLLGQSYFFEEELPRRRIRKVEEERSRAFQGSITHFMRALYHDNLEEEGFLINKIELISNIDRPSDEEIQEARKMLSETRDIFKKDSLQKLIKKEDFQKVVFSVSEETLDRSDLVEEARNGFKFLTYTDSFLVTFNGEPEEYNYRSQVIKVEGDDQRMVRRMMSRVISPLDVQMTQFTLTGNVLRIFEDGNYFPPLDLQLDGYMAWEKIGDLLPLNYNLSN